MSARFDFHFSYEARSTPAVPLGRWQLEQTREKIGSTVCCQTEKSPAPAGAKRRSAPDDNTHESPEGEPYKRASADMGASGVRWTAPRSRSPSRPPATNQKRDPPAASEVMLAPGAAV